MANTLTEQAFFPGNSGGSNGGKIDYSNPFYSIPQQYFPRNIDQMFQWSMYFLYRFPFYKPALQRIANYFITELDYIGGDAKTQDHYKNAFKQKKYRTVLGQVGLDVLSMGNSYTTFAPTFNRFLKCPACGKTTLIEKQKYRFRKGVYTSECSCGYKGVYEIEDVTIKDAKKIVIKHWKAREVLVRHETTTSLTEYYWDIPPEEGRQIMTDNNKFFSKYTPAIVYQAVKAKVAVVFADDNFIHLKVSSPTQLTTDGRGIPPAMFLFDEFWMLQVLNRQTEAIAYEDINPFRIISMARETTSTGSPLLTQNGSQFRAEMLSMVEAHRRDPGGYKITPFPISFEKPGGDGKNLIPVEFMQYKQNNILNGLNIPQELYTMNFTAQQVVGPALRLFENSWSEVPAMYTDFMQKWADVLSSLKGWEPIEVKMKPISLADDMERKQIITQLASANSVARSEMLEMYGLDYKEQIRKRYEEQITEQEIQQEEQSKQEIKNMSTKSIFNQQPNATPQDTMAQAQELANQLYPMNGAQRRAELQRIKSSDQNMWLNVKNELEKLTKSNGSPHGEAQQQQ